MKLLVSFGLIIFLFTSCGVQTHDKPFIVDILTNKNGDVSDIKIIRNKVDSNYIQLTFFSDGEIQRLREYKDGRENGKNIIWREKGMRSTDGYKTNGEYDGVTREVYDDGRTAFEGKRNNHEFEGLNNSFYKSGAIERRWNRHHNKDFGRSIYYYENGLIKEIRDYYETGYVLIGKWDENGEKVETVR